MIKSKLMSIVQQVKVMDYSKLIIFFLFFLFITNDSKAYFDPGTGSFLIQSLLALLAAIGSTFYLSYFKTKKFFYKNYRYLRIKIHKIYKKSFKK